MTCDEYADYIAHMARQPGWWQHARQRATEAEADDSGQWRGLREKVRALLGDFRPAPEEAKEWHFDLSLEERIALAGEQSKGLRKARYEYGAVEKNPKPMRGSRRLP